MDRSGCDVVGCLRGLLVAIGLEGFSGTGYI